jgi:hypothetical protein
MLTGYVTNIWHLIIQFVLFIKQDHYLTAIFHSEMVWPEAAGLSAGPAEKQQKNQQKKWEDTSNFGHFFDGIL